MGVTDHAQKELTDVVYVEVPPIGARVKAGKQCAVLESVKAGSETTRLCPVTLPR